MREMGPSQPIASEQSITPEQPAKSKKELLIDELERVLELKKQARARLKELQSFDFGEIMKNDPEMTPERWNKMKELFKREMRGETVEYPEHTAREKQVNEIYHQYLETRWVINDLKEKEEDLRDKIEIARMRETPAPANLPIIPVKESKTEPFTKAKTEESEPDEQPPAAETFKDTYNRLKDDFIRMMQTETIVSIELMKQRFNVDDAFAQKTLEFWESQKLVSAPDADGIRQILVPKEQPPVEQPPTPEQQELPRTAALITLARVNNYEELAAATEQEGNEKFLAKTRELWKELAVHGTSLPDKEGKITLMNFSDLDGNTAVSLMAIAGINTKNVQYIEKGSHIKGVVNLDTGDKHGVVVEDEGHTAFFDHHADNSGNTTCATKIVYETLISLGLLKKEPWLDRLVEFVTHIDNATYPSQNPIEDYKNSCRSLLGLAGEIKPNQFNQLAEFFKANRQPNEPLTDAELKNFGFKKRADAKKKDVDASVAVLESIDNKPPIAEQFTVESPIYGQIFIDIMDDKGKKTLPSGFQAAKAYGYGAYVIWNPKQNSFFVSTAEKPLQHSFSQGRQVRDTMWIKPLQDQSPLTITLKEILQTLVGKKRFKTPDTLKKYFKTETK